MSGAVSLANRETCSDRNRFTPLRYTRWSLANRETCSDRNSKSNVRAGIESLANRETCSIPQVPKFPPPPQKLPRHTRRTRRRLRVAQSEPLRPGPSDPWGRGWRGANHPRVGPGVQQLSGLMPIHCFCSNRIAGNKISWPSITIVGLCNSNLFGSG